MSPVQRATDAFTRRFGRPPRYEAAAPGRVNLIGDHTDYNEGFVLPMAIDRYAAVVADRSAEAESTLTALDLEEAVSVELSGTLSPEPGGFSTYLLGVAQEFRSRGHDLPELDAVLASSVPIGAGLSSSAAVEVAFARLLARVVGIAPDPLELATLCRDAEHRFAGTPCGLMDQFVAAHGQPGEAILLDCRTLEARPVPIPPGIVVLVADTGVRRSLAGGAYAERRRQCAEATRGLGVAALRDADAGLVAGSSLTGELRLRARHVVAENERVLLAAAALATGDLDALGELLFDSHASLRDLFAVSCPELDRLVETAAGLRGEGGVIGARMTGAGFGGCAIVLCRAEAADDVARTLEQAGTAAVFAA